MNDVFRPYLNKFVLIYPDDVLIVAKSIDEHKEHQCTALGLQCKHMLFIKHSKFKFGVNALKFLGHVISDKGTTIDPDKLKAILEWPEPAGTPAQCKTQLEGFLALAKFSRLVVDHIAKLAAPLNALAAEKTNWT